MYLAITPDCEAVVTEPNAGKNHAASMNALCNAVVCFTPSGLAQAPVGRPFASRVLVSLCTWYCAPWLAALKSSRLSAVFGPISRCPFRILSQLTLKSLVCLTLG